MNRTTCDDALMLLDRGWQEGLAATDFCSLADHLVRCAECATTVRAWTRVDAALDALRRALDNAGPRSGIAERVCDALARADAAFGYAGGGADESELACFLERLGRESALRERIARVANQQTRLTLLVNMARNQGFRFTESTVQRTLSQREAANDGELSDDQLEAVAGGASTGWALLHDLLRD